MKGHALVLVMPEIFSIVAFPSLKKSVGSKVVALSSLSLPFGHKRSTLPIKRIF